MSLRFTDDEYAAYERRRVQAIGNVEIVRGPRKEISVVSRQKRIVAAFTEPPKHPLVGLCRAAGIPAPIAEFHFAKPRMWRFDYAWPQDRLALEVDGGVWTQGRHNRGAGALADQEKLSEAAILGWRVLYAVPDDLRTGIALDRVMRALDDGGLPA